MSNIDPYLAVAIREQVQDKYDYDSSFGDFEPFFRLFLSNERCLSPRGRDWPFSDNFTEEECLAHPGWCTHRNCDMRDPRCASLCITGIPWSINQGLCLGNYSEYVQIYLGRPKLCGVCCQFSLEIILGR